MDWILKNILDIPYSLKVSELSNKFDEVEYYYITLISHETNNELTIQDVGFGIGQILPVIVQCLHPLNKNKFISIEQPELHLHVFPEVSH